MRWSSFLKRNFFTVHYFDSPSSKYYSEMYNRTVVLLKYINKEVSKRKVINALVLRTLFWLLCMHGVWLAHGTYQTTLCSPLTFKLWHCGTKDCIVTEEIGVRCLWPSGDWLLHISFWCKFLASMLLFQRSEEFEITGAPTANWTYDWLQHYVNLWATFSSVPVSCPSDFRHFEPLKKCVAGEHFVRYQHEASCHLLTTDTSHWFLLRQDTSLGAVVEQKFKCQWWLQGGLVCTICYPRCTSKSE